MKTQFSRNQSGPGFDNGQAVATALKFLEPGRKEGRLRHGLAAAVALLLLAVVAADAQQAGRSGSRGAGTRSYPGAGSIGDAYFSIDSETRRVVTIADEDTTKYISQVLSNLDRPKPQVLIKVVFLEVSYNNASDIGIEGGWGKNLGNSMAANAANAFGMSAINQAVGGTNAGVNMFGQPVQGFSPTPPGAGLYQILGQDYQVTLRAIAQAGNAKVLSRPSILARNNQPATITVGQSVPLITGVRYDNYGNQINSISYQDVGVILKVTPFITPDKMVEMIVSPQISSIDESTKVPIAVGVDAPVITVRSADTVAVTPDGQTVIIGGLISDTKAKAVSKIPFLGDVPLLGALFRRETKSGNKSELLIFLTPYIVEAPTQLAAVSQAEQNKSDLYKNLTEEELNKFLDQLPKEGSPAKGKKKK